MERRKGMLDRKALLLKGVHSRLDELDISIRSLDLLYEEDSATKRELHARMLQEQVSLQSMIKDLNKPECDVVLLPASMTGGW